MKPPVFDYITADTVEAALAALANAGGDAKLIAGGQSLMPMLNFRLARPSLLVDINRIPGLDRIHVDGDRVRVGALVRHHKLETSAVIAEHLPVVHAAMAHVAHLAIRNRGTIGGSLSHADPAAELPMMAALLDAELTIRSARATRIENASAFFVNALTTTLAPDEMLCEIAFARPRPDTGWGFEEFARRDGDFALAAAAALLRIDDGRIVEPRIALMGVGVTPVRAGAAEAVLAGQVLDAALLETAAEAVRSAIEPNTDLHASGDYRRHLAGVLTERVLATAARRAGGEI